MNTAGKSGTHETNMFKGPNLANEGGTRPVAESGKAGTTETQAPGSIPTSPGASEEPGRPKTTSKGPDEQEAVVIEVLTQESGTGTRASDSLYFGEEWPSSGFRWWYIPAIAVPVAVVAGTAVTTVVLLQRRRRQQLKAAELAAAAQATRNWLDALRIRQALAQAGGLVQQGIRRSRPSAAVVPARPRSWRDLFTDQAGSWRDLLIVQAGSWRDLFADQANKWRALALSGAQPYMNAAISQAEARRIRASLAVTRARRNINRTISHTLAFILGTLVTAATTYLLRWRQRTMEAETPPHRTDANQMREQPIL